MGIGVWSSKKDVHGRSDSDTPGLTYPFREIRSSKKLRDSSGAHEFLIGRRNYYSIGLYIIYRRMYIYIPASP